MGELIFFSFKYCSKGIFCSSLHTNLLSVRVIRILNFGATSLGLAELADGVSLTPFKVTEKKKRKQNLKSRSENQLEIKKVVILHLKRKSCEVLHTCLTVFWRPEVCNSSNS